MNFYRTLRRGLPVIFAAALAATACTSTHPLDQAEELITGGSYAEARPYADLAMERIDTMGVTNRCRLAVVYFRIADAAGGGDSLMGRAARPAVERFGRAYAASLAAGRDSAAAYYVGHFGPISASLLQALYERTALSD